MKIIRILSNNAVLAILDDGEECVALGKGIGFGKKNGELVNQELIESRFSKSSNSLNNFFSEILSDISPVYLKITEEIITRARSKLNIQIQDTLFLALCDHISFAVSRFKKGLTIHNQLLWEIRRLYPEAYAIGIEAIDLIESRVSIRLPEDEAGFIALHIVNAGGDSNLQNVILSTEIVKDILNITKYDLRIELNENSIDYHRFVTHLKFFAIRILDRKFIAHGDLSLYEELDSKIPQSWNCALKVVEYVKFHYNYKLTVDELAFLAIHIERVRNGNG